MILQNHSFVQLELHPFRLSVMVAYAWCYTWVCWYRRALLYMESRYVSVYVVDGN